MADLLTTDRLLLWRLACHAGRNHMARYLERSFYRTWEEWKNSNYLNIETLLNSMNPVVQDELQSIGNMLGYNGCFDGATYDNMTIYVDGTSGSDVTGDGSDSRPYQSLNFLQYGHFPNFINHNVRIVLRGNITAEALHFPQVLGPNGSLVIVGQGGPFTVPTTSGSGPFEIDTAGVGPYTVGGSNVGWRFNMKAPTTFGIDELYGKWLRFTDGPCQHECLPVHMNTATSIFTRSGWSGLPAAGNHVEIVEPLPTLTCPRLNFELRGSNYIHSDDRSSRFVLANLKIDITASPTAQRQFSVRNSCNSNISFVTLECESAMSNHCIIDGSLNRYTAWDNSVYTLSSTGIPNIDSLYDHGDDETNCGLLIYNNDWPPVAFVNDQARLFSTQIDSIVGIDARGLVLNSANLFRCAIGSVFVEADGYRAISDNFFSGDPAGAMVTLYRAPFLDLNRNWFNEGQDCIHVFFGDARLANCDSPGAGAITGFGIVFQKGAARVVSNAATGHTGLVGTGGQLFFNAGLGATAYPIADAQVTDALGNYFAYIST